MVIFNFHNFINYILYDSFICTSKLSDESFSYITLCKSTHDSKDMLA